MINLNAFAISGVLIVTSCLPILFFTLENFQKNPLIKKFCFHIISILIWGICAFLIGISDSYRISQTAWKFAMVSVTFIPVTAAEFVFTITNYKFKLLKFFIYLQGILFSFLFLLDIPVPALKWSFDQFYYHTGNRIYLSMFLLWLLILTFVQLLLLIYHKNTYPKEKRQLIFLVIAIPIAIISGSTNFLPVFDINVYPYGNLFVPMYMVILTYALFKHHLFDIKIVIKSSIVYSILITFITLVYLTSIVTIERYIQLFFGYQSIVISGIIAFLLGLIFIPLRNKIHYIVDLIFFKKSPQEIEKENQRLKEEIVRSEKLKSIATLASGVAHEIKNPLTAIKTFTEYLPHRLNDKKFLENFSRIVKNETDRIDNLVHELIDFAKPSPLKLKKTDPNKLIDDILTFLNNDFIKYRIKIKKQFDYSLNSNLKLDINQLKQAILNILLNGIDAMKSGGSLTIKTAAGISHFKIQIEDSGAGIPQKDLPNIFDPFFSTKDKGAGLGLSITNSIIQAHGGKIQVDSKEGEGTTFIIELPLTTSN